MDELNFEELERIPIPEGLEERLSAKIDEWETSALSQGEGERKRISFRPRILQYAAVAACIAIVFGLGYQKLGQNPAEQDTYQDPVLAKQEAERALTLLAMNLNKGMEHLEKANAINEKAKQTLNEQLNLLK
jgi:uncharacterized OsmC-like protein